MLIEVFNIEKAKAVMLFITQKIEDPDLLKIFKILYFAEQKHLAKHGSLILGDSFIAMKNGPVPSQIYTFFKGLRGDELQIPDATNFYDAFKVITSYKVEGLEEPNLEYLSKSNIICIEDSIRENRSLTFSQLSDKSHDSAWVNANKDDAMSYVEIAIAGGANDEMIKYINEYFELKHLLFT